MKDQTRGALNAICPYFTMFPLEFPFGILRRAKPERDTWVLDPFAGRGTTAYACRLLGLPTIAVDSSPVAAAISEAKLANTTPEEILAEAQAILQQGTGPADVPAGEFWDFAFHPTVLTAVCQLREQLQADSVSPARRALRAIILGGLHGPRHKVTPSYLSNQCQRTYAPKPGYAVRFWRRRELDPPLVDVVEVIRRRAERYYRNEVPAHGLVLRGDSRDGFDLGEVRVGWVVTSPPYYGLRTYLPDQWLRGWFLGGPPTVTYAVDGQISHSSPETFAGDLHRVWRNVAAVSRDGARMVIRFGGISDRKADPRELIRESLNGSGWRTLTVRQAGTAAAGRRQSLHFSQTAYVPANEYDVWTSLA